MRAYSLALLIVATACSASEETLPRKDADAVLDALRVDLRPECPEGLHLWPQGYCAPRLDECANPWELPLIGGGCPAIGPRGCPKLWDPDSNVECQAGELLDCPEGLSLTDDQLACKPVFDEDCPVDSIPVLGGGCVTVGPILPAGVDIPPTDGDCGPGEIRYSGGICVAVGPRACAKLWNPEAEVECEVGELKDCPKGWVASDHDLHCEPVLADCAPGMRPQFGGGCVSAAEPNGCPDGPFPVSPEDASTVAYVDAGSDCTDGCGSLDSPFASLQAAVNQAPDGGAVLVAAGNFQEGVVIDHPVQLIGLCASKTVVSGVVDVSGLVGGKAASAGIAVVGAGGVILRGLAVKSSAIGVLAMKEAEVQLISVEIGASVGIGLLAGGKSQVKASDVWVHDTVAGDKPGLDGSGLVAEDNSKIELEGVLIEGSVASGIYLTDKGSKLTGYELVVRNTSASASGFGGYGIRMRFNSKLDLTGSLLIGNHTAGLYVRENAAAEVQASVLSATSPNGDGEGGFGAACSGSGHLTLVDSLVHGNRSAGVVVTEPGTTASLEGVVLRQTAAGTGDQVVHQLLVAAGAQVSMSGSMIVDSLNTAVAAIDAGTEVVLAGVIIDNVQLLEGKPLATGINVADGAAIVASHTVVSHVVGFGGFAGMSGTSLELSDCEVRSAASSDTADAAGLVAADGAALSLTRTRLAHNQRTGLQTLGAQTTASVQHSVVAGTSHKSISEPGVGFAVQEGSHLVLADSLVDQTEGLGAFAHGPGSRLEVSRSVIRDSLSVGDDGTGYGLTISKEAQGEITACLLDGNRVSGLAVRGEESEVTVTNTLFRGPPGDQLAKWEYGFGAAAAYGAQVLLEGTAFLDCQLGVLATSPGTGMVLSRSLISGTDTNEKYNQGVGILAGDGAAIELTGSALLDNLGYAVAGAYPGTSINVKGSYIGRTGTDSYPFLGVGALSLDGAQVGLSYSIVQGSAGQGLAVEGEGAILDLAYVWVTGTGFRPDSAKLDNEVYGDGIVVQLGGKLNMTSSLVAENARCGLYLDNGTGELEHSMIVGNTAFGMATIASEVAYQGLDNFVFGNGVGMPPAQAADITGNPKGLPAPNLPEVAFPE